MAKLSAGFLVYRVQNDVLQVLLAHPGGPYWAKKDDGVWSLFKGELEEGEDPLTAAKREFQEETSQKLPDVPVLPLGDLKRKDGKTVMAWAVEADYDPATIKSNLFEMEWPPRSGKKQQFPENDLARWFDAAQSKQKLFMGQYVFVERLVALLKSKYPELKLGESGPEQPSLF
jgi:predicted NUDIX family NTP pyrophosphohydrolase